MGIKTVGIISPGDMGAATGKVLREHGLDVLACLEGRSDLTRLRAQEAGLRIVADYGELALSCDLILSILVPSEAVATAQQVADCVKAAGASPVYADLNAIAPQTTQRIGTIFSDAGARFVDGGILGGPPPEGNTRFYVSGPDLETVTALRDFGLDVRVVGDSVGQASGLKMVYAASSKGSTALWTQLLAGASAMGLGDMLAKELAGSPVFEAMRRSIPSMPRRSRRFVGEMEEIAATFESLGMTPRIFQGAADMYRLVGSGSMGRQTSREPDPSFEKVIETIEKELHSR